MHFLPPESNIFLPLVTFCVFLFTVSWRLAGLERHNYDPLTSQKSGVSSTVYTAVSQDYADGIHTCTSSLTAYCNAYTLFLLCLPLETKPKSLHCELRRLDESELCREWRVEKCNRDKQHKLKVFLLPDRYAHAFVGQELLWTVVRAEGMSVTTGHMYMETWFSGWWISFPCISHKSARAWQVICVTDVRFEGCSSQQWMAFPVMSQINFVDFVFHTAQHC